MPDGVSVVPKIGRGVPHICRSACAAATRRLPEDYVITPSLQQRHLGIVIPDWIVCYHKEWLKSDLIAGMTAAAVVIPMAMAYATIAGLPLQVGLYTALVPMLVYALLGSSRPLSVSTTSTLSILVGAQLGESSSHGSELQLVGALAML